MGLTRAEASFVLFLATTAFIGAWIPAIQEYMKSPAQDTRSADSTLAVLFKHVSLHENPDSAMIDSLMTYFKNDSAEKTLWKERSDSLRRMFQNGTPQSAVDSFIASKADEPVRTVNINTANVQTLTSLPGIGPKMAERIVEYRNQKGSFQSIDDLMKVKGIGKKTFAKLKPYIDI